RGGRAPAPSNSTSSPLSAAASSTRPATAPRRRSSRPSAGNCDAALARSGRTSVLLAPRQLLQPPPAAARQGVNHAAEGRHLLRREGRAAQHDPQVLAHRRLLLARMEEPRLV